MNDPDPKPEECDHDWKVVDESFDHEFGTEKVVYELCEKCGATHEHEEDTGPHEEDFHDN